MSVIVPFLPAARGGLRYDSFEESASERAANGYEIANAERRTFVAGSLASSELENSRSTRLFYFVDCHGEHHASGRLGPKRRQSGCRGPELCLCRAGHRQV